MGPAIVTVTARARARTVTAITITLCRYPPHQHLLPRPSVPLPVHLHQHPALPTPSSRSKDSSPVLAVQDHLHELHHLRLSQIRRPASRLAVQGPVFSGCSNISILGTGASPAALSGLCRLSRPLSLNRCRCFLCLRLLPHHRITLGIITISLDSESKRLTYQGRSYLIGRHLIGPLFPRPLFLRRLRRPLTSRYLCRRHPSLIPMQRYPLVQCRHPCPFNLHHQIEDVEGPILPEAQTLLFLHLRLHEARRPVV